MLVFKNYTDRKNATAEETMTITGANPISYKFIVQPAKQHSLIPIMS